VRLDRCPCFIRQPEQRHAQPPVTKPALNQESRSASSR
jgi:hypothetical protein